MRRVAFIALLVAACASAPHELSPAPQTIAVAASPAARTPDLTLPPTLHAASLSPSPQAVASLIAIGQEWLSEASLDITLDVFTERWNSASQPADVFHTWNEEETVAHLATASHFLPPHYQNTWQLVARTRDDGDIANITLIYSPVHDDAAAVGNFLQYGYMVELVQATFGLDFEHARQFVNEIGPAHADSTSYNEYLSVDGVVVDGPNRYRLGTNNGESVFIIRRND